MRVSFGRSNLVLLKYICVLAVTLVIVSCTDDPGLEPSSVNWKKYHLVEKGMAKEEQETALAPIHRECRKEGQIAFTFDQGPSQYTGVLLTALSQAGVKATFHVVPDYLENPVLSANLRRAASDGHLIGLFVSDSIGVSEMKDYLSNATKRIRQYTNYAPTFLRFPNPGPTPAILRLVTSLGYKVSSYNLDSQDYDSVSESAVGRVKDGKGAIFNTVKDILDLIIPPTLGSFICVQRDLVHASVLQTAAILKYAKDRGYNPVRLDACIGAGDSHSIENVPLGGIGSGLDGNSGSFGRDTGSYSQQSANASSITVSSLQVHFFVIAIIAILNLIQS